MPGFVYILQNSEGTFYVGSTDDLKRRLRQHKAGHTQTTRNLKDPKIILFQKYETLAEARRVERKIKRMKRKDYIEKMVADGYIKLAA